MLQEHGRDGNITSLERGIAQDGQASVEVTVVPVLPKMAQWAAGLPDGLLQVVPVLTPVAC